MRLKIRSIQPSNLIFKQESDWLRLDGRAADRARMFCVPLLYPAGLQLLDDCPRSFIFRLAATCIFVFLYAPNEQVLISVH
jgi:hypothetical protein